MSAMGQKLTLRQPIEFVRLKPDTEPGLEKWLDLNRQHSAVWPNITRKKPAPPDADAFVNVPDKFDKYFSPNPGEGD